MATWGIRSPARRIGALSRNGMYVVAATAAACAQGPARMPATAVAEQGATAVDACCAGPAGKPMCPASPSLSFGEACVCRVAAGGGNTALQGTACRVR